VNLAKALLKFTVVGAVGYVVFASHWDDIITMGFQAGLTDSLRILTTVAFDLLIWVCVAVVLMAAGDFIFQKTDMIRQLRMTRQEVQDEHKQTEGDPHMRAAMARQRRRLMSRIMEAVPKADVVVVNPTHYAVALKYDPTSSAAPVVLAKGMNLVALRMREVAQESGVPVIQNPPLCRAIYKATRIGQEIPVDLYEAVAEILAFVYRLRSSGGLRATA
jgi:flagellar biosynthesis protein FlhB